MAEGNETVFNRFSKLVGWFGFNVNLSSTCNYKEEYVRRQIPVFKLTLPQISKLLSKDERK